MRELDNAHRKKEIIESECVNLRDLVEHDRNAHAAQMAHGENEMNSLREHLRNKDLRTEEVERQLARLEDKSMGAEREQKNWQDMYYS